jgi:quinol monooxygenase YgiN
MTITRIGEMRAKTGQEEALHSFIESTVLPALQSAGGLQSCHLLQNQADPTRFILIELWDSIEAHQESVKAIDPRQIDTVMKLLAAPPRGEYFSDNGVA